jgi:hypothetical protein
MSALPIEQLWLVLLDLLTDLKKQNIDIPPEINKNMGFTKTQISFYKKDTSHPDMINEVAKASVTLSEIQNQLIDLAESEVSERYTEKWMDKIQRANKGEKLYDIPDIHSKFNLNPPPGFSTSRITFKKPMAEERVQFIAETHGLIIEFVDDFTVALYGNEDDVKAGIKEMGAFFLE